jgi:hypothetical protein
MHVLTLLFLTTPAVCQTGEQSQCALNRDISDKPVFIHAQLDRWFAHRIQDRTKAMRDKDDAT